VDRQNRVLTRRLDFPPIGLRPDQQL
jgi:hypothetical protein